MRCPTRESFYSERERKRNIWTILGKFANLFAHPTAGCDRKKLMQNSNCELRGEHAEKINEFHFIFSCLFMQRHLLAEYINIVWSRWNCSKVMIVIVDGLWLWLRWRHPRNTLPHHCWLWTWPVAVTTECNELLLIFSLFIVFNWLNRSVRWLMTSTIWRWSISQTFICCYYWRGDAIVCYDFLLSLWPHTART